LPALSVTLADGSTIPLSGSDHVVVLNFWASYCEPCRAEAPVLSEVEAQAKDVRVVGLSVQALSAEVVTRQANQLGMHFGVGVADEALLSQLRVQSVPTTYVISKSGKIVLSHVGALQKRDLAAALEEAARDAS
jgi:thiol-disulfide isomerase/thioredoxin